MSVEGHVEIENCFSHNDHDDHRGHSAKHPHFVTLTSGTTTISDQSTANTDVIFAGTSLNNEPTLQFIGPATFTGYYPDNRAYSVSSLTVAGNPLTGGSPVYGALGIDYSTNLTVTNGILVSDGQLNVTQGVGSGLILNGNSQIDNGGTFTDAGRGRQSGASITINGTLTLGANGTNVFYPNVAGVSGVVRELGKNDSVSISQVGTNFRIDDRAGTFSSVSSVSNFTGTIGPAPSSNAPILGKDATIDLFLNNNVASTIYEAYVNTSSGIISFLNNSGKDVYDAHFTGNAHGLNISTQQSFLVLTYHPGTASPTPITFS